MELDTGRERVAPRIPGLILLLHAARTVAADEEAIAVLGLRRIVPALRSDRHARSIVIRVPCRRTREEEGEEARGRARHLPRLPDRQQGRAAVAVACALAEVED